MMDYVERLFLAGDPTEKSAVELLEMPSLFPRYAEFWVKFVVDNRDEKEPWKFYDGFAEDIQRIANTHYSILNHIVKAKKQNIALESQLTDIIDFEEPLAHLATACDLVRTLLVLVSLEELNIPLDKADSKLKTSKMRRDLYDKIELTGKEGDFNFNSKRIENYRNVLLHSVPPLKWIQSNTNVLLVPKYELIETKRLQYWSSASLNIDDFYIAHELIDNYLENVLKSINHLWEILILKMEKYVKNSYIPPHSKPNLQSKYVHNKDLNEKYTGGSAIYQVPPSAYYKDNGGDW